MWISGEFTDLPPLSIPHHGGKDFPPGTQQSILDQLEDDIAAWAERVEQNDVDDTQQIGEHEEDDDGRD